MITGYNNDIKHRGTVFHVQTEDKGEASAWIESLIYTGGRILARKRATYKQLLEEGADRPAIAKLMERQHRLMIRQIREGRFDDETNDGMPGRQPPVADDDPDIHTARMQQQAEAMFAPSGTTGTPAPEVLEQEAARARAEVDGEPAREHERAEEASGAEEAPESASETDAEETEREASEATSEPAEPSEAEEPVESAEEPTQEPAEAADAVEPAGVDESASPSPAEDASAIETGEPESEPEPEAEAKEEDAASAEEDDDVDVVVGPAPTLDQVIFDYLSSVAQEESLVLLMDESPALASGTTTRMDLGTHASRSGKPVADASIAVRMISKTGGPVTLAEGVTDDEGTLQLVVDVPEVERDSAALIITAVSSIGNAEIKHLL